MTNLKEYEPGTPFPGKIGRTIEESSPAWPAPIRAKEGSPNVIFFVLDDVGYGQLSSFGGLINTPNIDRLAENGLRYSNMHTTALCSPTRSCVLTGRNHHSNGVACIMEMSTGYPGYNCTIPFENGFITETLKKNGYNTFCIGKWHLTPATETSPAGPFDRWPLGRGFERFYGFLGGETNQWYPDLVEDNGPVHQPKLPEEGYHLNEDLSNKAIQYILNSHVNAPDKPFFLYYSTGAAHAPHHVGKEWIEKYKGKFDMGWDEYRKIVFKRQKEIGIIPENAELTPRDPDVPEWSTLTSDQKQLFSKFMEVFAGFVEQTDYHFGRILEALEEIGELDNTLIMAISDNGASAEGGTIGLFNEMAFFNFIQEDFDEIFKKMDHLGGTSSYNHYPWGWAWCGDTPFRRWKRETYRGGTSDPFVLFWPKGIKSRGEIRYQYAHAIDMMPTILDTLGITPPKILNGYIQSPVEGVSFAHTFDDAKSSSKHKTQYFEMFGHRALYHEGWRAVCAWPAPNFTEAAKRGYSFADPISSKELERLEESGWELYNLEDDFTESKNIANKNTKKLKAMIKLWWDEAEKYKVLPIDGTGTQRISEPRPMLTKDRSKFIYYPNLAPTPALSAPQVFNRPYSIEAVLDIPNGDIEGVILACGGLTGGYSLYVKDKKVHYVYNYSAMKEFKVSSNKDIAEGEMKIRFEFEVTGEPKIREGKGTPGLAKLYFGEELVGATNIPMTLPIAFGLDPLSCGYDAGEAVTQDYVVPFMFTGKIKHVTVDLSGELIKNDEATLKRLMAQQ